MFPLARLGRFAALAAAVVAAGCAPVTVNSHVERGYDLSRFHTYAWGTQAASATGDPRLDSNGIFDARVRAEVDERLAMRGFEKTSAAPDLLVHYHASVGQRIDAGRLDRRDVWCEKHDCGPDVYDAGTILIDLVDARTDALVWRGWAEGSIDGVVDHQDAMDATIGRAVARILAQLPRHL